MALKIWNERLYSIGKQIWSGTKVVNGTLTNTAVGGVTGAVVVTITAHGMTVGNTIIISGTTNYDGVHTITAIAANTITINATFVAETPAGSETYKQCFIPPGGEDFQVMEVRFTLSAAGGSAEAYTIDLDSGNGAAWDAELDTVADTTATASDIWKAWEERRYFDSDDKITFEYANTNSRTWGIELIYRSYA